MDIIHTAYFNIACKYCTSCNWCVCVCVYCIYKYIYTHSLHFGLDAELHFIMLYTFQRHYMNLIKARLLLFTLRKVVRSLPNNLKSFCSGKWKLAADPSHLSYKL